jgi:hypothetical protein
MNNKILGSMALAGAPFFLLSIYLQPLFASFNQSQVYGIWSTIYITAWLCSVLALIRLKATGNRPFGRTILRVLVTSLLLADLSNIYQIILPGDRSLLFVVLDAFWPISNLLMLVTGITVLKVKGLSGWHRFIPLLVGCWLPVLVLCGIIFGRTTITGTIAGAYAAIAWSLLAIVVMKPAKVRAEEKQVAVAYELA